MSDLPYCDESPHDFLKLLVMFRFQRFSSVEGALHKYVHPRRAQRPNTRREQLPPYLFQVQLTSLLSMKTTWFWSERQLNSLDETMIFQVWNE